MKLRWIERIQKGIHLSIPGQFRTQKKIKVLQFWTSTGGGNIGIWQDVPTEIEKIKDKK